MEKELAQVCTHLKLANAGHVITHKGANTSITAAVVVTAPQACILLDSCLMQHRNTLFSGKDDILSIKVLVM